MNIHISDMMIYVIAILSTIVVLIDLLRMERKREQEEKKFNKDV